MIDHGIRALATVLHDRNKKNLLYLTTHLRPEHFSNGHQRLIFQVLDAYFLKTGGVIKLDLLIDMLERRGWDAGRILPVEEAFKLAEAVEVSEDEARHSVETLREILSHEMTGQAFAQAYEILDSGAVLDGEELRGAKDARNYIISEVAEIEGASNEAMPEGNIAAQTISIWEAYNRAKSGEVKGIPLGFPSLDEATGGLNAGELALIAAYTSHGKSQMCVQLAWRTAVIEGKNVYYGTTETLKHQIEARILSRHSVQPQFGHPMGLDSKKIMQGTLTSDEEKIFKAVLDDLQNNEDYGSLHITQYDHNARLSTAFANMTRVNQQTPVDFAVIDSLNLLHPERRRGTQREEFNDLLQDAKRHAASFDNGRGVRLVSPWQMSVASYITALEEGRYTLQKSLGETQEAQRSADLVVSLMHNVDQPRKAMMQALKVRNAPLPDDMPLSVDYRCSLLVEGELEAHTQKKASEASPLTAAALLGY